MSTRTFWRALVDNAVRLVDDAQTLYPTSPARAQALVVLAYEELGKAEWVFAASWKRWLDRSEEAVEVPALRDHWCNHIEKFISADGQMDWIWLAWNVQFDEPACEPEVISAAKARRQCLETARDADRSKQNSLYVDRLPDGMPSIPHEIDRPGLASEIVMAAQLCVSAIASDSTMAEHGLDAMPDMLNVLARIKPIAESREAPYERDCPDFG